MNVAERLTVMRRPYAHRPPDRFSDPARCRRAPSVRSQALTRVRRGRVTSMLTHDGITSSLRWSPARYCDGVSPTISVKRELKEPSEVQPTAMQVSVTDTP